MILMCSVYNVSFMKVRSSFDSQFTVFTTSCLCGNMSRIAPREHTKLRGKSGKWKGRDSAFWSKSGFRAILLSALWQTQNTGQGEQGEERERALDGNSEAAAEVHYASMAALHFGPDSTCTFWKQYLTSSLNMEEIITKFFVTIFSL